MGLVVGGSGVPKWVGRTGGGPEERSRHHTAAVPAAIESAWPDSSPYFWRRRPKQSSLHRFHGFERQQISHPFSIEFLWPERRVDEGVAAAYLKGWNLCPH